MLELSDIRRSFPGPSGRVNAVAGVSLAVNAGEFAAICGPSGCGKSTLMLIAGGLLRPEGGTVRIGQTDVYGLGASARARLRASSVGFVFQQFHLVPYLSALDNMRVPIMALGRPSETSRERAWNLLRTLGLEGRGDHVPARLSVGEQQRVALGRALVNRPSIVLADEPTGNLDPASAEAVLACLAGYVSEGGSVLLVTHDGRAAARATRVIRMIDGALAS